MTSLIKVQLEKVDVAIVIAESAAQSFVFLCVTKFLLVLTYVYMCTQCDKRFRDKGESL